MAADAPGLPVFTDLEREALARRARGETNRVILADLRRSGKWLAETFRKAGLPLRTAQGRSREPSAEKVAAKPSPVATASGPASGSLDDRLERLLSGRIADLELQLHTGRLADPERAARALALNVRTLATLRRVASGPDDDPTQPNAETKPQRSLSQLRDELREHMFRLRAEGRSRRRARSAQSDRAGK